MSTSNKEREENKIMMWMVEFRKFKNGHFERMTVSLEKAEKMMTKRQMETFLELGTINTRNGIATIKRVD